MQHQMTPEVRAAVVLRDGGCVAPRIDPRAGPCFDWLGRPLTHPLVGIEVDYVNRGSRGGRHELAGDHVTLCPGHHRGTGPGTHGYIWATAHRAELRAYLEGVTRGIAS